MKWEIEKNSMSEKKSSSRKRVQSKQKSLEGKPLDRMEKDENRSSRKEDQPIISALALGIVAVLIGLTVGGFIASRYFEPPVQEGAVDEGLVNRLAEQLAAQKLADGVQLDPEIVKGYTQAVAPMPVSDGAGNEVTPEPTHTRYVNDFYGISLMFPIAWTADASVEIQDETVRLAQLSSNEVEMIVSAVKYDERSFKSATQKRFTTVEEVSAAIEEKRAQYASLFPDATEAFPLSVETTDFGYDARRFDAHDAYVDWYVEPVLNGEPLLVRRRYFIDSGRGLMLEVKVTFPVAVGVDPVTGAELENPFNEIVDAVMNTWRFTNDGIGDETEGADDLVQ